MQKFLEPDARCHVNPKKSAIEHFILLNEACGNSRVLMPMTSFDIKFITLSELDLTKVYWQELLLRRISDQVVLGDVVL